MAGCHHERHSGCGCCSPYMWPLLGPRRAASARRAVLGGMAAATVLAACGTGSARGRWAPGDPPGALAAAALAAHGRAGGPASLPTGAPDTVYRNARVLTMDPARPEAEAVAVAGGRIAAVGGDAEIMALAGPGTRLDDLGGLVLLPGFVDGHGHTASTGLHPGLADLRPPAGAVRSFDALQRALRDHRDRRDPGGGGSGGWIVGAGYDDALLRERRHPDRHDLDAATGGQPAFVWHVSGHLGVANSKALELAGIGAGTPDPNGGVIRRLPGSKTPSGIVEERALYVFQDAMPPLGAAELLDCLDEAQRRYAAWGITTAQDGATRDAEMDLLRAADDAGRLRLDVVTYPWIDSIGELMRDAPAPGGYRGRPRVGGAKLVLDGSPQGKTAWLTAPYHVPPEGRSAHYRGYPLFSDADMEAIVDALFARGWQVLAHCNGDAAGDQFLAAAAAAAGRHGAADRRPVMIHAQMAREDQLDRMAALGVMPSFFVTHTFYWGDWHRDSVMGPERAARVSPAASAQARGMPFTLHSDSPVTPSDARMLLWSAVNRATRSGAVLGGDQRIDVTAALKALTIDGAYQHFEEDIKGSVSPGKLADLVILADDPRAVAPETLKDIEIVETIKDGAPIHTMR